MVRDQVQLTPEQLAAIREIAHREGVWLSHVVRRGEAAVLQASMDAWLATGRRDLSLVDVTSFLRMRREAISVALPADYDFDEPGYECLPER